MVVRVIVMWWLCVTLIFLHHSYAMMKNLESFTFSLDTLIIVAKLSTNGPFPLIIDRVRALNYSRYLSWASTSGFHAQQRDFDLRKCFHSGCISVSVRLKQSMRYFVLLNETLPFPFWERNLYHVSKMELWQYLQLYPWTWNHELNPNLMLKWVIAWPKLYFKLG